MPLPNCVSEHTTLSGKPWQPAGPRFANIQKSKPVLHQLYWQKRFAFKLRSSPFQGNATFYSALPFPNIGRNSPFCGRFTGRNSVHFQVKYNFIFPRKAVKFQGQGKWLLLAFGDMMSIMQRYMAGQDLRVPRCVCESVQKS